MLERACLHPLSSRVDRLSDRALHVDLIQTSEGLIRMGSMPDVAKMMARFKRQEAMVILPQWRVTQAGDNHTGEEFVQWHAQVYGAQRRKYIGQSNNLSVFYRNLAAIFPFYFDPSRLSIIHKKWLNDWIEKAPVEKVFKLRDVEVRFQKGNILVYERGQKIYDLIASGYGAGAEDRVEAALSTVKRDSVSRPDPEVVVVGSGNGFFETTSSLVVRFGRRVLWIDPCSQPAHSLAEVGIHWDDITEVLITHNHEDHISGFPACLKRKMDRGKKLRIITTETIYEVLRKQFKPLLPQMEEAILLLAVIPGKLLNLNGMHIIPRLNHHFLPYGTLGIKICTGNKTLGFSGDTKFDRRINKILNRPELEGHWFNDCDLLFHEVDFENPAGVHSYWREVETIKEQIACELLTYHTKSQATPPLSIAQKGKTYRFG